MCVRSMLENAVFRAGVSNRTYDQSTDQTPCIRLKQLKLQLEKDRIA
jgi:hypothetical protein